MLFKEAAVSARLDKTGAIFAATCKLLNGAGFLGTNIVEPGIIFTDENERIDVPTFFASPFGRTTYIEDLSPVDLMPPAKPI